jgi:hypothetical protein
VRVIREPKIPIPNEKCNKSSSNLNVSFNNIPRKTIDEIILEKENLSKADYKTDFASFTRGSMSKPDDKVIDEDNLLGPIINNNPFDQNRDQNDIDISGIKERLELISTKADTYYWKIYPGSDEEKLTSCVKDQLSQYYVTPELLGCLVTDLHKCLFLLKK